MARALNQAVERVQRKAVEVWGGLPAPWRHIAVGAGAGLLFAFAMTKQIYFGIALALLIGGVGALLFEPVAVVYAVILLMPMNWITVLGRNLKATTVLVLPAFAYAIFLVLFKKERVREPLVWAYLVFVGVWFLSLLNAIDVSWSLFYIKVPLFSYCFAFAMLVFIKSTDQLKVVWWILALHGIWLSVLAILQSIGGAPYYPLVRRGLVDESLLHYYKVAGLFRASGTFETGPRFALFLLIPFSLAVARSIDLKRTIMARIFWMSATALILIGLLLSLTRAVFVVVPLISYIVFRKLGRSKLLLRMVLYLLAIAALTAIVSVWLLPSEVGRALGHRFAPSGTSFYMDRVYFMYIAFRAFLEHPLLGVGIGNFPMVSWGLMQKYPVFWYAPFWDVNPLAFREHISVHNSYVRILAETSVWGLGAMIAIIVLAFRNYARALKRLEGTSIYPSAVAMFACFVGMVIYWFPHEYFIEETYTSVFVIAMSAVLKKLADRYEGSGSMDASSRSQMMR